MFEELLFEQINNHMEIKFSKRLPGDRIITTGVPQSSIIEPLLFKVFINDTFAFTKSSNICNYANDNTLFAFIKNFEKVLKIFRMIF